MIPHGTISEGISRCLSVVCRCVNHCRSAAFCNLTWMFNSKEAGWRVKGPDVSLCCLLLLFLRGEEKEALVMRLMPHCVRDPGLNQPPVLSKRDLLGSQQVHVLNIQSALSHTEQGVLYIYALSQINSYCCIFRWQTRWSEYKSTQTYSLSWHSRVLSFKSYKLICLCCAASYDYSAAEVSTVHIPA